MYSVDEPSAPNSFDILTPELWIMVFEQLAVSPAETDRESIYYLGALALPFAFARYILSPNFFNAKYHSDPTALRVKSLVREYARCIVVWCNMPWLSIVPFLAECKALKDLEWTYAWEQIVDHRFNAAKLSLQQFPHVRLHLLSSIKDPNSFDLVPAPNLTTLSLHISGRGHLTELCKVLLASKNLRTLNLHGRIDISPQTGQFPAVQELAVNSFLYTPHSNFQLWDFSNLQYLQISLPDIQSMIQEIPPQDMLKIRKLQLSYPQHPGDQEWEHRGQPWREAVEEFLRCRMMPQLEELSVSCFRPHILAPALEKTAPRLKHLNLTDTAPHSVPRNSTPDDVHVLLGACPGLQSLRIDMPHLLLQLDSEVIYRLSFCRFHDLTDLQLVFNGRYCNMELPNGDDAISDSAQVRYRGLIRRAKMYIVRWKTGTPLRRLRIDAYDMPWTGSMEEGALHLDCTWDSEGKESVYAVGTGTFESEMDDLGDGKFG